LDITATRSFPSNRWIDRSITEETIPSRNLAETIFLIIRKDGENVHSLSKREKGFLLRKKLEATPARRRSTLPLLVAGVAANDIDMPPSSHDFAILTNAFDTGSNFHDRFRLMDVV
jgi:hypothetical protein